MHFNTLAFHYVSRTRKEARRLGHKKYLYGNVGGMAHTCWKLSSNNQCSGCRNIRYQTDPLFREKCRERVRKSKSRPEYRESANKRKRERYASDPVFREKEKEVSRKGAQRRRKENPEKVLGSYRKAYQKKKSTPKGRAELAWRYLLARCIRAGWRKSGSTDDELGYTPEDLRLNIESKFRDGMTWMNHGEWHIDHIRPLSSFPEGAPPHVVNALDNLQPLWAAENLSKYTS